MLAKFFWCARNVLSKITRGFVSPNGPKFHKCSQLVVILHDVMR